MIDAHPDLAGFRKGNLSQGLWDERIITHNERDFLVGNECVRGLNVGERVYREYTQNRVRGTVLGSEGGPKATFLMRVKICLVIFHGRSRGYGSASNLR